MRKSKLLIITNIFPHKKNPQYGTYVKEQVESLRNRFSNELEIDVYFINGSKSNLEYLKALFRLPQVIKKKQYDIAHVHYGLSLISTLFIFIPIVVTFHGSDLSIWYVKLLAKLLQFKASRKVVVSKALKRVIPSATVIPCGIDVNMFALPEKILSNRIVGHKNIKSLVVLFPGNPLNGVKNYQLFDEVCKCFEQKGINVKRVHLTNIKREEVPKVFWNCDLMILTSFREGSPTVIKEAIAAKLPFVSVDVGDVAEWVNCINFGVISKSFDPDEIATLSIKLLESFTSKSDFDNAMTVNRFSTETISKRIKILYDETIKKSV
jgi:glycosyltransferase involved in cell wall biosynthesis